MRNILKYSFRKLSCQNIKWNHLQSLKICWTLLFLFWQLLKRIRLQCSLMNFQFSQNLRSDMDGHLKDNHMLSGSTRSHLKMSFIICFSGTGKVAIKGNKSGTISEMIAVFIEEIIENFFDNNDHINLTNIYCWQLQPSLNSTSSRYTDKKKS